MRGVDKTWTRNLYGFAIAPHLIFYLKIDEKTLILASPDGLSERENDWQDGKQLCAPISIIPRAFAMSSAFDSR